MEWTIRQFFCYFGFHAYYLIHVDENKNTTFVCPHCGDYLEMSDG